MSKIGCGGFELGSGFSMNGNTLELTGGTGKRWYSFSLTPSEVESIGYGDKIVKKFDEPYDPSSFKGDYFTCYVNNTGETEGKALYSNEEMSKMYIDLNELTFVAPYLTKTIDYAMYNVGFDHNYYRTIVLYAGGDDTGILSGDNVLEGKNVVYLQDVTQQSWERNPSDGGKPVNSSDRETLDKEWMNGAYVMSVKGKNDANTVALLIANDNEQAAYWNSTDNATRWANIEAGKVYPVVFDGTAAGQHGTLRWLIPSSNIEFDEETGEANAVEIADEVKESLYETGIEFEADKFAATLLEDTAISLKTECVGNGEKSLISFMSFNQPFETPAEEHMLEFVGRPTCYMNQSFEWYEDDGETVTWYTEEDGIYMWTVVINNVDIMIFVPKTYSDRYIIAASIDQSFTNTYLVRHTITVKSTDLTTIPDGDYAMNLCFSGVNSSWGEDSLYYVLHSDFNEEDTNWILPASGFIGQVSSGAVSTWYPVLRFIGGSKVVGENRVPCLYAEYFNTTDGTVTKVEVVDDDNVWNYNARDFRSEIAIVSSPASSDVKAAY